ncbi:MAG: hypothetical protein ISS78_03355 [Phycisphaerae bacterium]|nr:hypothetical protein [Phycisphaerae bacterium]
MAVAKKDGRPLPYLAAILAWLVPGAGHIYIGRRARGIIILVTIAATFWTGVAFGGVMTVDYHNQRWWFVAEMGAGIHGLASWYRQDVVYEKLRADMLNDRQFRSQLASSQSRADLSLLHQTYMDKVMQAGGVALVAPTETIARAYSGIAGLLNVMCIFDVLILSVMGVRGEAQSNGRYEGGTA